MRLVGKKFLIKIEDNPLNNKVIKIIHNDKTTGYVTYVDDDNNVYDGKIWHITHRIENMLWIEVK
jgi:hypothetical protein